jgi:peptidoglycan hydrolase-like protein with peptidoglycan-binding domain
VPDTKIFILNSWSDQWGDKGTGWFWWSEYKAFINEAWTAIDVPQSSLDEAHNLPHPEAFKYEFKVPMAFGDKSVEIKALQKALQLGGEFPLEQAITENYGPITASAVLAFQKKYAVASLIELLFLRGRRVGPKTLVKLNELFNK